MGPRFFNRGNQPALMKDTSAALELQWGHDFSTVEIAFTGSSVLQEQLASMGPRFFNRGNSVYVGFAAWCPGPLLQWGHDFSTVEMALQLTKQRDPAFASMGPRFFNRGNLDNIAPVGEADWLLQWGHDFSTVEIAVAHAKRFLRQM